MASTTFPSDNLGGDGDSLDLVGLISSYLGPSSASASASNDAAADGDAAKRSSPPGRDIASSSSSPCSSRVIIFSKDRPWQLQQLLKSMRLCGSSLTQHMSIELSIFIIARASTPEFSSGYEKVASEYETIDFLFEDDNAEGKSFWLLLQHSLAFDGCGCGNDDKYLMCLTDDCLLLEPLEDILACAIGALRSSDAFNFMARLHPGISWCQTRGVPSPPPRDDMKYQSLAHSVGDQSNLRHDGVYLYDRKRGEIEWAYHFDLSGGVYRFEDVVNLLDCMKVEEKNHPNLLEMKANKMLHVKCEEFGKQSAIPTRPLLLVLAVNRVQDVYQAPLALPQNADEGSANEDKLSVGPRDEVDPSDPVSLLDLFNDETSLDVEKYKLTLYSTSHVGDFFLLRDQEVVVHELPKPAPTQPKISVLIPIHSGPHHASIHSIVSVMMQPIEEVRRADSGNGVHNIDLLLTPMQIVIVDDRCTDGSVDSMIESCQDLLRSHNDFSLTLRDLRDEAMPRRGGLNSGWGRYEILLDVVRSPGSGVACALNHGLSYCRANIVARMDADDISAPSRLLTQMAFMHANPSFAAVGTSIVSFSTKQAKNKYRETQTSCDDLILPYEELTQAPAQSCVGRSSVSISDPGFIAFTMFFTCTIAHPSVMYRKEVILDLGYDESITKCEDYDLWLRLLHLNIRSIVCLPFLGLWHRKHSQSSSSVGCTSQREEADKACHQAIGRLFQSVISENDSSLTLHQVSTLRNPSCAQSPECLVLAAELLLRLESCFLEKNSAHLSHQEITLIEQDCNARIAEFATTLVTKFETELADVDSNFVWRLWCDRCPEKQLERLSLLCHSMTNQQN